LRSPSLLRQSRQEVFYFWWREQPELNTRRERHAATTRDAEDDGLRQVPCLHAALPSGPYLALQAAREGATLVLGGFAGRKPGAHRSDGPRAQAAHVRDPRQDGIQGDRGRLPLGIAARLRLRPHSDRGGSDSG